MGLIILLQSSLSLPLSTYVHRFVLAGLYLIIHNSDEGGFSIRINGDNK